MVIVARKFIRGRRSAPSLPVWGIVALALFGAQSATRVYAASSPPEIVVSVAD